MKKHVSYGAAAVVGLSLVVVGSAGFHETVQATRYEGKQETPIVFQAAGPTGASILSMVDAFRASIGGVNNANTAGPLAEGRREINWDGGGSTATAPAPTPFDGFLVTRGGRFTTRGTGFLQAPLDGLVTTFNNPTYATIFQAFSPVRLFSPVNSNVTNARFFVPGGGEIPATTAAFGAVFSDVDQAGAGKDDDKRDKHGFDYGDNGKDRDKDKEEATTTMAFYDVRGKELYTAIVPASKGDASLSFVGVQFSDARIAYVRIKTGNVNPGPYDSARRDVVMMDDFIYGEPQTIEDAYDRQDIATLEDK
jgi:hypothetical protein